MRNVGEGAGVGASDAVQEVSRDELMRAGGIHVEAEGGLATVTLSRPERRNAQTPATWRALAAVGRELSGDVRVAVLRAEGPSFSAGLDRRMLTPEGIPGEPSPLELASWTDADLDAATAGFQEAFTWWRRTDLVSVAAVQGHAIGAGCQLALACDLRVLADDAQLALPEVSLGLVPDLGGTKRLVDLVGFSRALEICATGRRVDADEAVRLGLAELAVPRQELDAATGDLATALLQAPRNALIEVKALLAGAASRDLDAQLAAERAAQARRLRDLAGLGE